MHRIVVPSPALDKHLCLKKRVEQLPVQKLISELAAKRLRRPLLQHGDGAVGVRRTLRVEL
jgi:hypothetical protein